MPSTADRLLETSNRAIAARQSQEQAEASLVRDALEKTRQSYQDQAETLFEPILEDIKRVANNGNKSFQAYYNGDNKTDLIRMQVLAEEARSKHGFRTEFRQEDSDMGDSAAPCRITRYWLEISWGEVKPRKYSW